jgi:hypothetical protein
MESDQRLSVCRRDAPNADERFCRRIRPADDVFGTHTPRAAPAAERVVRRRGGLPSERRKSLSQVPEPHPKMSHCRLTRSAMPAAQICDPPVGRMNREITFETLSL